MICEHALPRYAEYRSREGQRGAKNMRIFGNLFKKAEKPTLDDPVFGHIDFESKNGVGLWCHIPSASDHMVVINAPVTGPTQAQRDFYATLRKNLPTLETACKAFIGKQDSAPANLSQMTVYAVDVGPENEIVTGQFVFELSDKDAKEIHRVGFRNGKPEVYGVDD